MNRSIRLVPTLPWPCRLPLAALCVLSAGGLRFPAAQAATILPLGNLPGGAFHSGASAVSGNGGVVVGEAIEGFVGKPLYWTFDTGTIGLGTLGSDPQGAEAFGISPNGQHVVGRSVSNDRGEEGFYWSAGTGMVGLGLPPGGAVMDSGSWANDVSGDGSIVVGGVRSAIPGERGFRWSAGTGYQYLEPLPGQRGGVAAAISNDGSRIVGTSYGVHAQAVRYDGGTTPASLGTVVGRPRTDATGISGNGQVVVGGAYLQQPVTSRFVGEAMRWDEVNGMVTLDHIPGGVLAQARGVSDDGNVVVGWESLTALGSIAAPSDGVAFLWTPLLGSVPLMGLLGDLGVDTLEWTSLITAEDVSDDGRYVVGYGMRFGHREAFRVDLGLNWTAQFVSAVPEPSTYAVGGLVTLGIVAGVRQRRRREAAATAGNT